MEAMSITSLFSSLIFSIKEIVIAFLILLVLLSPNSYSLNPNYKHETLDSTKDVLVEEKSRLGSMPPSCYNKCNQCHPCRAIQCRYRAYRVIMVSNQVAMWLEPKLGPWTTAR
ncbi:EPIDERMAL PATTERNING FACTOR-like protein 1 isoform X2 [Solanum stenotomum]|uniref:EPIDERMAL PATTERNING FACTOR-like protein 1 isoform X2 n=1 Tax=Solanum stenotomum TaxID=172797 RepID=UPI0020D1684A|nr:EPIDERMAL PATTERNING FACTOR-like protein 1 isoform X2 [Solanum stenotomum]